MMTLLLNLIHQPDNEASVLGKIAESIATMSNLKPNAQEDKDVESVSDSPGRTLEPLQSHTFSLKNNAAAVKPETQEEHTCPLCCGWFDTKTGLSNHVRGHLKRIGRSFTSTSKSPLCILNELLQDKMEHQNILQVLSKSQYPSRSFVPPKLRSSKDLVLMSTGIPVKIKQERRSPHPMSDSFVPKQEAEAFSDRKKLPVEAKRGSKASSSTLVELLKMRQESLELTARNNQEVYASRKLCDLTKEYMEETQITGVGPTWTHEEYDPNKICIQCNGTFPRLPGHFRAYAHRKRLGIFEEPGYDYKQKKPRPRPGLKKKILPSLNAEIYTLTCRFCDLVFQGPLSVQEDWIKHLQRHLLHTRVPHSGTGMVEVLGPHHKKQIGTSVSLAAVIRGSGPLIMTCPLASYSEVPQTACGRKGGGREKKKKAEKSIGFHYLVGQCHWSVNDPVTAEVQG
ncbi:zinc finger protein 644 isoform X10 [Acanthopagrus latus]|uniref:zinc finger protein 644 isoform X10 n=1 Tax=Acanthopagrus latus TaxID=8177 RepID=UPI00187C0231|nr:zinc finger protein 644 isoform X10 [Acanthopagrus latus]